MAIEIVGGPQPQRWAGARVKQTFSQSTATAFQSLALDFPVVTLGMGTATGAARNLYSLASGAIPGQDISILATATGEAKLLITAGTATGMWVFTEADDFLKATYEEGKWRIIQSTATLSTGT